MRPFEHRPPFSRQMQKPGRLCGNRWTILRNRHMRCNPHCAQCGRPGEEVHHVVSRAVAPERTYDPSNLRTLCRACHHASHQSHGNAIVRHPADANELRQVMEERDEARRDACMSWAWMYRPSENAETEARKEAKRRGWDCFEGRKR